MFKAAINAMNKWRDNLDEGTGATGSHGRPYRDTGEAVSDVTISPQEYGSLEYSVGGDVVQLAIAEFGRIATPGRPPPYGPIAEWVQRKGIASVGDPGFKKTVDAIRWHIAAHGLEGFAPGQKAGFDTMIEAKKDFSDMTKEAIGQG